MSQDTRDAVDKVLLNVKSSRRDLLKRLLIGSGAALLIPVSTVVADAQVTEPGRGKGKRKGKGKRTGTGKGRGKGKAKGKAKGKGSA